MKTERKVNVKLSHIVKQSECSLLMWWCDDWAVTHTWHGTMNLSMRTCWLYCVQHEPVHVLLLYLSWRHLPFVPFPLPKIVKHVGRVSTRGYYKCEGGILVWWPLMDKQIEERVKGCWECQQHQPAPAKAPLHPWEWPFKPWSRLRVDFARSVEGHMLLILVDAYSKWIEVCAVKSTTSDVAMWCLRSVFARFGLPNTLVSDNGPCFVSAEFETFLERNGIQHVTASPHHPASNGLAERAVQTVKNGLKKMQPGPITDRLARLLFSYRTTPHTTTGTTPADLLLGRQLQTRFHKLYPDRREVVEKHQTRPYRHKSSDTAVSIQGSLPPRSVPVLSGEEVWWQSCDSYLTLHDELKHENMLIVLCTACAAALFKLKAPAVCAFSSAQNCEERWPH